MNGGYDELLLADLKIGYRITDWAKASMTVNDLFDEEPYYNYKMPGRRIMGTLEFTILGNRLDLNKFYSAKNDKRY